MLSSLFKFSPKLNNHFNTTSIHFESAQLIKGKAVCNPIKEKIIEETKILTEKLGKKPGIAVVLVGNRPDSRAYVSKKKQNAIDCGFNSFAEELPETVSEEELLKIVQKLNSNSDVNGILVQLPLPKHINEEKILDAISIEKDVDGFSPENIGKLSMKGREPLFIPCTPNGCMDLIESSGIKISGKDAVVVGRSNIVGIPAAMLLLKKNATVQIVHSRTKDIEEKIRKADIIVAAVGVPRFVKGDWIKPGAVVIDVGINQIEDKTRKSGKRLVGDVDFDSAKDVAGHITPVPGGVGVCTVIKLMENVLRAFKQQNDIKE